MAGTCLTVDQLIAISFHAGYSGLCLKGEIYYLSSQIQHRQQAVERCDKGRLPGSSLGHCHITVISPRPLTSLRILCNQIYLRQLYPVPGLHTR